MRFKVWHNCDEVTLTINEGEEFNVSSGGSTEEGWFRCNDRYFMEDGILHCERDSSERDCDGRVDTHGLYKVESFTLDRWPVWERVESSQRDYEAEKAGY